MKGLEIFLHSAKLLVRNLPQALRASLVPSLIIGATFWMTMRTIPIDKLFEMQENPEQYADEAGQILLAMLIFLAVFLFCTSWIAVAWHRYVLVEEDPGAIPPLHLEAIGSYVWRGFMIGLVMLIPAFILSALGAAVVGPGGELGPGGLSVVQLLLFFLIVMVPLLVLFYRLATVLPGYALGKRHGFFDGWSATEGAMGTLFSVAIIATLVNVVLNVLVEALGQAGSTVDLIVGLVTLWVQTMLGISVLTTLYGHYVEKRAL